MLELLEKTHADAGERSGLDEGLAARLSHPTHPIADVLRGSYDPDRDI